MDEYLRPNSSFLRLYNEYREYGSLVIAYDLDNTVYDFHNKGEQYWDIIMLLRDLKKANCFMICFTANTDMEFIKAHLKDFNIPYDAINENPPFFKCEARKIYYNAMLDDRCGLSQVYNELTLLLTLIKDK